MRRPSCRKHRGDRAGIRGGRAWTLGNLGQPASSSQNRILRHISERSPPGSGTCPSRASRSNASPTWYSPSSAEAEYCQRTSPPHGYRGGRLVPRRRRSPPLDAGGRGTARARRRDRRGQRSSSRRPHDRGEADSACAENRDRRAGTHAHRDQHGARAGLDSATERTQNLERQRPVHDHRVARSGDRVRRERRLTEPARPDRLSRGIRGGRRAVEVSPAQIPGKESLAVRGMSTATVRATPAAIEGQYDMIANGDAHDPTSNRLHHTGPLMAWNQWQRGEGGELRGTRHHVGVTHADSRDAHEDLPRRRTRELERFDGVRCVARTKHRGANLHRPLCAGAISTGVRPCRSISRVARPCSSAWNVMALPPRSSYVTPGFNRSMPLFCVPAPAPG